MGNIFSAGEILRAARKNLFTAGLLECGARDVTGERVYNAQTTGTKPLQVCRSFHVEYSTVRDCVAKGYAGN